MDHYQIELSVLQRRIIEESRQYPYVWVNSCAGSGKTRLLLAKYLDLLEHTNIAPSEVLIVTFTRHAAAEMRRRLEELDAPLPAYIGTLHGYVWELIRRSMKYPPVVLDREEAEKVPVEDLGRWVTADDRMIDWALAKGIRPEHVRAVLWDEAQDTSELDVAFLHAMDPEMIFAVGDPHQAIFGFAGKDGALIREIIYRYEGATFHLLETWRNARKIAELANILKKPDALIHMDILTPPETPEGSILTPSPGSYWRMDMTISIHVAQALEQGTVGVLTATNRQADLISQSLGGSYRTLGKPPEELQRLFRLARYKTAPESIQERMWFVRLTAEALDNDERLWRQFKGTRAHAGARTLEQLMELVPASKAWKQYIKGMDLGQYQDWYLSGRWRDVWRDQELVVTTFHSAKGLEWDTVILADMDGLVWMNDLERRKVYYVGVTRARRRLVVLTPTWPPLEQAIEEVLR